MFIPVLVWRYLLILSFGFCCCFENEKDRLLGADNPLSLNLIETVELVIVN